MWLAKEALLWNGVPEFYIDSAYLKIFGVRQNATPPMQAPSQDASEAENPTAISDV